ncbi:MAG: phosphate ABC transporter permease PstA [Puniceicoccales bacterium]|jgi:phosphate transport system permease protein|nr:phosphate ABC transporter permease PstA [Puniceicoccales bacterium]
MQTNVPGKNSGVQPAAAALGRDAGNGGCETLLPAAPRVTPTSFATPAFTFPQRGRWVKIREKIATVALCCATWAVLLCGFAILGTIAVKGAGTLFKTTPPFINMDFLTRAPETLHVFEDGGRTLEFGDQAFREFSASKRVEDPTWAPKNERSFVYSAGGIFPNIVGTLLLAAGSMAVALALGVSTAVYLNEYARQGRLVEIVRLAILNLAGVPSIVFGLFGYGMFVVFFGWNTSLMAGWFTLAFMVLPVVATAAEEALKAVPAGFREASFALGATRWQTLCKTVLPCAMPGILTSSILGVARVAGETAPIMFTAAYVLRDKLPWEVSRVADFFFQGVMALPYHIYVVSSKIPQNEYTERTQYGATLVFLLLVAAIAAASVILRGRLRRRRRW